MTQKFNSIAKTTHFCLIVLIILSLILLPASFAQDKTRSEITKNIKKTNTLSNSWAKIVPIKPGYIFSSSPNNDNTDSNNDHLATLSIDSKVQLLAAGISGVDDCPGECINNSQCEGMYGPCYKCQGGCSDGVCVPRSEGASCTRLAEPAGPGKCSADASSCDALCAAYDGRLCDRTGEICKGGTWEEEAEDSDQDNVCCVGGTCEGAPAVGGGGAPGRLNIRLYCTDNGNSNPAGVSIDEPRSTGAETLTWQTSYCNCEGNYYIESWLIEEPTGGQGGNINCRMGQTSGGDRRATLVLGCSSHGYAYAECPVSGAKTIHSVSVKTRHSGSACTLGQSFGITGTKIWVNHGCRADFNVDATVKGSASCILPKGDNQVNRPIYDINNYDESPEYCQDPACGWGDRENGWLPELSTYDSGSVRNNRITGKALNGHCCGDDYSDDPDMGSSACLRCIRQDNAEMVTAEGHQTKRAWSQTVSNNEPGSGCCGDDELESPDHKDYSDCLNVYSSSICADVGGTLEAAAAQQGGGGGDCCNLGPERCAALPGSPAPCEALPGGGGAIISDNNPPYATDNSEWLWRTAGGAFTGVIYDVTCAQYQIVSRSSDWISCNDYLINTGNHAGEKAFDIDGPLAYRDGQGVSHGLELIPSGVNSPVVDINNHGYYCYPNNYGLTDTTNYNARYEIAECCGERQQDCRSSSLEGGERSIVGEAKYTLYNPDFELSQDSWDDGCQLCTIRGVSGSDPVIASNKVYSGTKSMKLHHSGSGIEYKSTRISSPIFTLRPYSQYLLRFYVNAERIRLRHDVLYNKGGYGIFFVSSGLDKTTNAADIVIEDCPTGTCASYNYEDNINALGINDTNGWELREIKFNTNRLGDPGSTQSNHFQAYFVLYFDGGINGDVYFDDFSLFRKVGGDWEPAVYYCMNPARWGKNLDNANHKSCEGTEVPIKTGFKWTGEACCGEDDEYTEFYNDPSTDSTGVCYSNTFQPNHGYVDLRGYTYKELYVENGRIYGCAINNELAAENSEFMGAERGDYDREQRSNKDRAPFNELNGRPYIPNKPYFGTVNFVTNGDFENSNHGDEAVAGWTGLYRVPRQPIENYSKVLSLYVTDEAQSVIIPINRNKVYTFSAEIFNHFQDSDARANIYNAANYVLLCKLGSTRNSNGWEFKLCDNITGVDNVYIKLETNGTSGDQTWFDNIRLAQDDFFMDFYDVKDSRDNVNPEDYSSGARLITPDRDMPYCSYVELGDPAKEKFCSYTEQWLPTNSQNKSKLSYINWTPPADKTYSIQYAECCNETACWDGTQCIEKQNADPLVPSVNNGMNDGYRCIDGEWYWSFLKYTPDGQFKGYCPDNTQCLYNITGLYLNESFPQCFNHGQYIGDDFCYNGTWTSRTKFLALDMMHKGDQDGSSGDYTLMCGKYDEVLNFCNYNVSGYSLTYGGVCDLYLNAMTITGEPILNNKCTTLGGDHITCANHFCVLRYENGGETRVFVGTTLNQPFDLTNFSFIEALGVSPISICNGIVSNQFVPCGSQGISYNPQIHGIVFSKHSPGTFGINKNISADVTSFHEDTDVFTELRTYYEAIVNFLLSGTIPGYDFVANTTKFNKIYIDKHDSKLVVAVLEQDMYTPLGDFPQGGYKNYLAAEFHNFDVDVCQSVNVFTHPTINCLKDDSDDIYRLFFQSAMDIDKIYFDITSKLRVKP